MTNPTPGQRPPWVDDRLFPFESRFVQVAGQSVHYVDEGDGQPVLMLHGNPTWSFLYRDLVHALSDGFRCIAVDYPGFGLSEPGRGYGFTAAEHRKVIVEFVRSLDLENVIVMVQDWGGPIGIGSMLVDPDRYAGLIIGNTWAWPADSDRTIRWFSRIGGGPIGALAFKRLNLFVRMFIPQGHKRRKLTTAEMAMYKGPFPTPASREPIWVFPRELLAARPLLAECEAGLPSLAGQPVLIVWGEADDAFGEDSLERWQKTFPRARTVVLPGAGHYIQDDAGHDIAAAIRSTFAPT